jgi:hypothetical protein
MQVFGAEIDGVRYRITVYLIFSIVVITSISMILTAFGKNIPDFIGGAVIGGLISQLGNAVTGLFKSRDEIQSAKNEVAKVEAAKCP